MPAHGRFPKSAANGHKKKYRKGLKDSKSYIPLLASTQMCKKVLYSASAAIDSSLHHGSTQK